MKRRENLHIQKRDYVYFYLIRDNLCSSIYSTIGSEEKRGTNAQCAKNTQNMRTQKNVMQSIFATNFLATWKSYICYLGEGRVNILSLCYWIPVVTWESLLLLVYLNYGG